MSSEKLQVKQRYVGWLLGRGGSAIAEIEKASGCQILVNQETKSFGHSIVQLIGTDVQRDAARAAIEASVEKAKVAREGRLSEETVEIEQRMVGWLLGKKGGLVQEIEQETGALVKIDQSTSHMGYSTVALTGTADQVDSARDRILASLEKAGSAPLVQKAAQRAFAAEATGAASRGSSCSVQVTVEQQWVGWLLGKGGAAVRDLEASTQAKISLNQDSKDQGFSTIHLSGTPFQILAAYDAMTESLKRAGGTLGELPTWIRSTTTLPSLASGLGPGLPAGGPPADLGPAMLVLARAFVEECGPDGLRRVLPLLQDVLGSRPDLVAAMEKISQVPLRTRSGRPELVRERSRSPHRAEITVEQHKVGWLLGGRGRAIQQIEEETGASIHIDQSTKSAGYSVVQVSGSIPAVHQAQKRIQGSLAIFNKDAQVPGMENVEMQVEQRLVGWILGKSGTVLREIEAQSGACVAIDQSTKELGFSTVRISGDMLQCQSAKQLIEVKMKEAQALR